MMFSLAIAGLFMQASARAGSFTGIFIFSPVQAIFADINIIMQQLITAYLFQHNNCPLPGLGTLSIVARASESDFIHKQLLAPVPVIQFSEDDTDAAGLVNYIGTKKGISSSEAENELYDIAAKLKSGGVLEGAGTFSLDAGGNVHFEAKKLPAYFIPAIPAERVIRPEADHTILVGDKETTAAVMTEYYAEEPVRKSYWWVWAIVLAAIGIAVIFIYLNDRNSAASFGNAVGYQLA